MQIECQGCHEIFDIPVDKKVTHVVCPFCDRSNDIRKPSMLHPSFLKKTIGAPMSTGLTKSNKAQPHALAPQFWVLAICALIVTAIICISFLFTVVAMVEMGKANEQMMGKLDNMSEGLNHSMAPFSKHMQHSRQNIVKP